MTTESNVFQPTLPATAMNRREFLTYAWGTALALLTAEVAATSYFFLYPRFRVGEFGGKFLVGNADALPATDAAPQPAIAGKFWLVNTAEGVKAIYMVCTHLGCLYKWEASENQFRCPCHGSIFTREGHYIDGPAPRSLDQFVVSVVEDGQTQASTTETDQGAQPPAILNANAQIVVDTGKRILGQPEDRSPAKASRI